MSERPVKFVVYDDKSRQTLKGFLIRAGRFVAKTKGRLVADPNPWAQDVARIFKKFPHVEEINIVDKEGYHHGYWRERL